MSATDYLNNAQEWLAQQSQRTIDYQWEIQHHNQMHKAYETSWQVFLDLSNFQQQYNGQGKTICLFHTNRLTRAVGCILPRLYTLHLSPLTHTRLSCARRWFAVSPCLSPAKGSVLTQMPLGRCISATCSACQNRSLFRRTMISSKNISNSSERTQSFCKTQKLFGATACQSRT